MPRSQAASRWVRGCWVGLAETLARARCFSSNELLRMELLYLIRCIQHVRKHMCGGGHGVFPDREAGMAQMHPLFLLHLHWPHLLPKHIHACYHKRKSTHSCMRMQVVLHFWASWCEPCKHMDTVLAALAKDHPGVAFMRVRGQALQGLCGALPCVPAYALCRNFTGQ